MKTARCKAALPLLKVLLFFFYFPSLSPISLMFSSGDSFFVIKELKFALFGGDTRLSAISRKYQAKQIKVNLQGFCLRAFLVERLRWEVGVKKITALNKYTSESG